MSCIFHSSSFLYVGFAGLGKVASVLVLVYRRSWLGKRLGNHNCVFEGDRDVN